MPYRDSKLTRVLEGSVGRELPHNSTCCASPSSGFDVGNVVGVSFAQRAMRCECKAVVNVAEVGDFSGALDS